MELNERYHSPRITRTNPSLVATLRRYSYIPRAARSVPHAHTVHTIHVKKVTYYPLTSRLNYIIKMDWKRGAPLRPSWATFNSLRIPESYGRWQTSSAFHYEVQPISSSSPAESLNPVLPTPRTFECAIWTTRFSHSGPYVHSPIVLGTFCLPSFTIILKALLHRYVYWPPSRTTPPTSPSRLLLRPSASTHMEPASSLYHPRSGLSSRADMSDSSV